MVNKVQGFQFLNGTMRHFIVGVAVSSNPIIALTDELFGITHLESMINLLVNQLLDLHKQNLKTIPESNFK